MAAKRMPTRKRKGVQAARGLKPLPVSVNDREKNDGHLEERLGGRHYRVEGIVPATIENFKFVKFC